MATFGMTCSCGETMSVEAASRDAAVGMLKQGMTADAISAHFAQHHKTDEQRPSVEQAHAMIDQMVR